MIIIDIYKSTMYKNVQSKVFKQTKMKNDIPHPINNSRRSNKYNHQREKTKKIVRPNSATTKSIDIKSENININNNYEPKPSMFEEYYKDKLNNYNENNYSNNNQFLDDSQNKKEMNEEQISNNIQNNNNINIKNEVEKNKNHKFKRPLTATNKDPRKKDFLADSKYIISCIQRANNSNKFKKNNSKEKAYHKEFGKTPKYLQNMKIEAEKKKEIEKLKKETSKYPKGTRLLSEEERLFTLEKLKQSKNDINQIIEKLPITCDSQAFRNKKEELFRKLDEIDNAIETFSRKKVFVKIEGQ